MNDVSKNEHGEFAQEEAARIAVMKLRKEKEKVKKVLTTIHFQEYRPLSIQLIS